MRFWRDVGEAMTEAFTAERVRDQPLRWVVLDLPDGFEWPDPFAPQFSSIYPTTVTEEIVWGGGER